MVNDIARIIKQGLFNDYYNLFYNAPIRGKVKSRKIFEDDHLGTVGKGPISNKGDGPISLTEKRLAIAIWNYEKLTLPCEHGFIRLPDYEFPLRATGYDKAIGEVDLLGLTDCGVLSVIELKYMKDNDPGDSPLFALVEALRYSAIIEANLDYIKTAMDRKRADNEVEGRWDNEIKFDKPRIMLIANRRWWEYWDDRNTNKKGKWKDLFFDLLVDIRDELSIKTECYTIYDFSEKDIKWEGVHENKPVLLSDPDLQPWK